MAKNPYFPFFVRDWLCSRRVKLMSGDAVKAYVYLLSQSWLEIPRATLPKNDIELAIIANVTMEKWMQIKDEVLQHFETGKCKEHLGRFYQETLLEISRNSESKQRFNNKNAKRTQNKRKRNADAEYEYDTEYDIKNTSELKKNEEGMQGGKKEEKIKHHDFVYLTIKQHENLCEKYGKDETAEAIKFLDEYLSNNPKKRKEYSDHNKALQNWVFTAVKEKKTKETRFNQSQGVLI